MDIATLLQKSAPGFNPGIGWSVNTHADAKNLGPGVRHDGMEVLTRNDNAWWLVSDTSTAVDATENLVMTPTIGAGALLRVDKSLDIKLAVDFTVADAAVLFTVPVGFKLSIRRVFWEVTVAFTGGASAAIGLSSSNAGYNTKGDIQGGAAGDLLAALTAGYRPGTLGTKFGSNGAVVLVAGDTIRFDRIASAFTAGAGFAHLQVDVLS